MRPSSSHDFSGEKFSASAVSNMQTTHSVNLSYIQGNCNGQGTLNCTEHKKPMDSEFLARRLVRVAPIQNRGNGWLCRDPLLRLSRQLMFLIHCPFLSVASSPLGSSFLRHLFSWTKLSQGCESLSCCRLHRHPTESMDPEFLLRMADPRRQTDGISRANSTPRASLALLGSSISITSTDRSGLSYIRGGQSSGSGAVLNRFCCWF